MKMHVLLRTIAKIRDIFVNPADRQKNK